MRVLNASQMRDADRRAIDEIGLPSLVLMENAGRQTVAAMEAMYDDLSERHVGEPLTVQVDPQPHRLAAFPHTEGQPTGH